MALQPSIPPIFIPAIPGTGAATAAATTAAPQYSGKQRLYFDLMKTIYPDPGLLRQVIYKHHEDLAALAKIITHDDEVIYFDELLKFANNPDNLSDSDIAHLISALPKFGMTIRRPEQIRHVIRRYDAIGDPVFRMVQRALFPDESERTVAIEIFDRVWNEILREMADLGFEFHYFAFFRSANPRVIAFWGGIQPTPQNFEIGTSLITPEIYEDILKLISTDRENQLDSRTPDVDLLSEFDPDHPLGQILSPAGKNMIGWRKRDLFDAIKATGLTKVEVVPDPRSANFVDLFAEGFRVNRDAIIDLSRKGIVKSGRKTSELSEMFGYTDRSSRGTMPGFKTTPYMPKLYYEAIYRKLFNTMINIDWVQVCKQKLVEYPKMRQIAVSDFGFRYNDVKQLNYTEICDLLEQESKRRRAIQEELMAGVPELQPALLYQPGGRIMRSTQAEAAKLRPGTFAPTETVSHASPQLQRLVDMCADPDVTRDQIFTLAQEMDLEILFARLPQAAPTKEDYCGVLKNYLERTQARSPQ